MASTPLECCNAAGGRALVAINGVSVSPRKVGIMPITLEREAKSNQDGTIYTINKPVPAEADLTLSDACGLDILALMGCPINVTIDLLDVHRRYLFTSGVIVGRPKLETETGEWSNIKVVSQLVSWSDY